MRRVAEKLRRLLNDSGERWVFLKGGHLPGNDTIDVLHDGDRLIELPGRRIETRNTHGTGCTLSAALAALLPQVNDVPEACRRAKAYLIQAIARSGELDGRSEEPTSELQSLMRISEAVLRLKKTKDI